MASREQVEHVLAEFVACSGAGEPLRVWSLYSDAYLARLLSRERGYDRARYELDAEPRPAPEREWPQATVASVSWEVDTGRTVADVSIFYPSLERTKLLRFWFVWEDGRLRIDEVDGEISFAVP